jgi:polyhydroxyalkanoate synthesis regulator phasin
VLDDLRSYLQMASGLTEATTSKAKDVVTGLLSQGLSLSAKAVPAPEMMGQVQELADDLVTTSRNNREMLVGMIRAEVDRAVGRMGFVREDELAALRRHVQRLEKQIAELESATPPPAPAATWPATPAPAEAVTVQQAAEEPATEATADAPPESTDTPAAADAEAGQDEPAADVPKKKKKKIILDPEAGS